MKILRYGSPVELLGKSINIYLKDGGKFIFKVTGCDSFSIDGYDDEGMNLTIALSDIDYIIGS